jgi:hypothetical protein
MKQIGQFLVEPAVQKPSVPMNFSITDGAFLPKDNNYYILAYQVRCVCFYCINFDRMEAF